MKVRDIAFLLAAIIAYIVVGGTLWILGSFSRRVRIYHRNHWVADTYVHND